MERTITTGKYKFYIYKWKKDWASHILIWDLKNMNFSFGINQLENLQDKWIWKTHEQKQLGTVSNHNSHSLTRAGNIQKTRMMLNKTYRKAFSVIKHQTGSTNLVCSQGRYNGSATLCKGYSWFIVSSL